MNVTGNNSLSESDTTGQMDISDHVDQTTPPNFVSDRHRRGIEHQYRNDDFRAFKEEMVNMISSLMSPQQEEIKKIYPTLMAIKTTNVNIESAMAVLSAQNEDLKKKIDHLETRVKRDNEYIIILEDKVEDLQRITRKSHFEIKNVPKVQLETKENLVQMVATLSQAVKSNIDAKDITDIYRVQNKRTNTKNSTVVVELSSTLLKADFIKKTRDYNRHSQEKICAKHLGFKTGEYTPIYVSEQLTTKGSRLFYLARDLAKSRDYKFCWTSFGKVYVRKDETAPTIIINSESQVNNLMQLK